MADGDLQTTNRISASGCLDVSADLAERLRFHIRGKFGDAFAFMQVYFFNT